MPYKPPLHIIDKNQAPAPRSELKPSHGRDYQISMFTLSYRIKGAALGLALALAYCYFFLQTWPAQYLLAGPIVGWILGWLVGRFFYSDKK